MFDFQVLYQLFNLDKLEFKFFDFVFSKASPAVFIYCWAGEICEHMDQTNLRRRLMPEQDFLRSEKEKYTGDNKVMDQEINTNTVKKDLDLNRNGTDELFEGSMATGNVSGENGGVLDIAGKEEVSRVNNDNDDGLLREDDGFTVVERRNKKEKQTLNVSNLTKERDLIEDKNEQRNYVIAKENIHARATANTEGYNNKARQRHRVEYKREWTVLIESEDILQLNVMTLIKEIELVVGHGALLALRPKQNRQFEATLNSEIACEKIEDGLMYKAQRVGVKRLHKSEVLVSFLHLPPDVNDREILDRLTRWGVLPILPVKRRYYPGTNVADGTRFLKVRFPKEVVSLPYSARFDTVDGPQYCRVIHDRQVKICRLCMSPGHVLRDCQGFTCRECLQQGHYARECESAKCPDCRRAIIRCICVSDSESEVEEQQVKETGNEQSGLVSGREPSEPPQNDESGSESKSEGEMGIDFELPCDQPQAEPAASPGSTEAVVDEVGSVDLVEGAGKLCLAGAVPVGGLGQDLKEPEEKDLQQQKEMKVNDLGQNFEEMSSNDSALHIVLKNRKKKKLSINLERVLLEQERRRGTRAANP